MIKYREILRLDSQQVSKRGIAASCRCSRNTINDVLEEAERKGISWPLPEELGDRELQKLLFPEKYTKDERYTWTTSIKKWQKRASYSLFSGMSTYSLAEPEIKFPIAIVSSVESMASLSPPPKPPCESNESQLKFLKSIGPVRP